MTKIGNTGPGGIRPPDPEAIQDVKQTVTPKDAAPVSESFSPRDATADKQAGDKYAAGELKSAGNRVKTDLDSKLAPSSKDTPAWKMAPASKEAPIGKHVPTLPTPTFAPPYVPVGPVVMGDNIAAPGAMTPGSETQQMNLKPDQFNINDQGNLVITNQKLIDFFKSLKEKATGDINLLISNLKLPDKE
jgi:hypothetical protein